MIIREIEKKDDKEVENVIRTCLKEFGGDREGLAWADPDLGCFSKVYSRDKSKYWVVEDNGRVVGGCGIGPVENVEGVCELQKMYCLQEARGTGIAHELMVKALEFASEYYEKCYIETLSNMEAANKFYKKYNFTQLEKPLCDTEHYACDVWYIKSLKR